MRMIILILCLAAIIGAGCSTIRTDAKGTPLAKGKYETKKAAGIAYSRQPIQSTSAKADASIMRFLLWTAAVGALVAIAGILCGAVSKWKQIPLPFWDELLVTGAIVCGVALLSVWLYPLLKWILIGGGGCCSGYRLIKGLRKRKAKANATAPEIADTSAPVDIAG